MSTRRTPDKVRGYAESARECGIEVIIAGASEAAALPEPSGFLDYSADNRRSSSLLVT